MLNLIRMNLYRLVRMKSFYVIMIITVFMNIATLAIGEDIKSDPKQAELLKQTEEIKDDPMADIGMNISIVSREDGNYNFVDVMAAPLQGMFCALLVGIFTVIFATADFSTGDIKNYGGAIRHRYQIVVSKVVTVAIYTVYFLILFGLSSCIGVWAAGRKVVFAKMGEACGYLGVQTILHITFAAVITCICMILRSNLLSMILTACISMHALAAVYALLDKVLVKAGFSNAKIVHYTVSGRIMEYAPGSTKMLGSTLLIAGIFLAVFLVGSSLFVTKRDLV